jgi:anti-sigma-K factor RskA
MFLAQLTSDGALMIRPLAPTQVATGKDMELWALPEGATRPVSLGVLPPIGRRVMLADVKMGDMKMQGTQLLVSLEPQGGSPTGQPTGPVLYAGTLSRL